MTTWFTADLHLGHANILRHCQRPFTNVEEMDENLIELWNVCVRPKDTIYVAGDLIWQGARLVDYLGRLNGTIHLILGNHDERFARIYGAHARISSVSHLKEIRIAGHHVVLCHYPLRSWRGSNRGAWQLHGHCHGTMEPLPNQLDVGVDGWEYRPIEEEEVARYFHHWKEHYEQLRQRRLDLEPQQDKEST